ncbi:hypothetical protein GCM10009760_08360 [Kitasatospora kazusensis]|uniref:YcaO domain-containing protein n=1 Tax=Kitasatospora kazusensis TaxID=407974 RepID=A0ABN2YX28_9ACTN
MAAYEEIAETRPRIRRDVLFSRTPNGVLFHNAHGGFNLTTKEAYRFASLLVPHLNGRHRVAELCQGLAEQQRSMVVELVRALYKRDFARDAGPEPVAALPAEVAARFAPQIDYVDHYVGEAASRFQRFRETRVAVLGDDALARWCVLSLVRNGCATVGVPAGAAEAGSGAGSGFAEVEAELRALAEDGCPVELIRIGGADRPGGGPAAGGLDWADLDGFDLVVVTGGSAGPRQVVRLLEAGIPDGRRLLPAWLLGGRAVVGPLMAPRTPGCWVCAALRLEANSEPGPAAELWSGVAPLAPLTAGDRPLGGPLAAMIGNLLGYEVFRLTTGALPAETDGRLLIQDLDSLDVVTEPLLPHPRCPRCSADAATLPADFADLPETAEDRLPADGAAEEAAAQAALAELDTRAVLVQPQAGVFGRYADDTWNQTPLKVGTVELGVGHGVRRQISAFDVHHVAGARLRALYRAAEVHTEHVVPLTGTLRAAGAAADPRPRIAPAALATASGVAGPDAEVTAWHPAGSLLTGTRVLVPAAALRPFGPDNRDRFFEATAAGTGAGGTAGGATARALLTALSYDALRRAVRGVSPAGLVTLDSLRDDVELTFLARSAKNLGLELELLELGTTPLPVVLARAAGPGEGPGVWTVGSGTRLRQAVLEAVRDLLGRVQLGRDLGGPAVDPGDPLLGELDAGTLTAGRESTADLGTGADWPEVLAALRGAGRDVLVAPAGSADLRAGRIEVVRVLLADGTSGAR